MNVTNSTNIDFSTTWVVVAAYNEESTVGKVVKDLKKYNYKVVVIDDGSVDHTFTIAQEAGAVVVQHPFNLGQGAALQTGIDFSLRWGAHFVVTFDADGQHLASDVPVMLASLVDKNADIACGSRFLGTATNIPKIRHLFLQMATLFTLFTSRLCMTDAHNGLRAMTRSCAMSIHFRQNRMAHASEIISEIVRHKFKFIEVPVTIRYSVDSLQKGQSLSNSINIILDLIIKRFYR